MLGVYHHPDRVVLRAASNDVAIGEVVVKREGLGRSLSIIDNETGAIVGTVTLTQPPRTEKPPPAPPTAEQEELAATRARACEPCDQNQGVTIQNRSLDKRTVYLRSVNCKACGCGGLSLVSGVCPIGKWPTL